MKWAQSFLRFLPLLFLLPSLVNAQGPGDSCTASAGSSTGATSHCTSGYCRSGGCADFPTRNVGETCTSDSVCVGDETAYDTPPYCGNIPGQTPLICGGPATFCYEGGGDSTGCSPTCASGICKSNRCTRLDPLEAGQPCLGDYECSGEIFCVNGACTGGESSCSADAGNPQSIGVSDDCDSQFCRAGQCSNVPAAVLGDVCEEDRDCSGSDDNLNLLYCGQSRANVRKCGSVGASCVATDGTGSGAAPELCISGQCDNYACNDAAPSPGLAARANIPTQQVIKARLCPKDFEPCPLYPKGYECIDVLNDIESCGGCVGRGMPGTDCSADIHAREIACVQGECIIACEPGYSLASNNNTCIAE